MGKRRLPVLVTKGRLIYLYNKGVSSGVSRLSPNDMKLPRCDSH